MPRNRTKALILATCILGLAASTASVGHAERTSTTSPTAKTPMPQVAQQICPWPRIQRLKSLDVLRVRRIAHTPMPRLTCRLG